MNRQLFEPFTLPTGLTLPNRLVLAPMTTYASRPDGVISDDEIPYVQRRAEDGFGLVMTAACCIHPSGHAFDGQWHCSDDRFIPSLRRVADAIREGGAKSCLQIHHGGRQCPSRLCGRPISASAIPAERPNAETPHAMTEEEIVEMIFAYGDAARRGREAGFDSIEIHGANTYLIQQFVSPHSNRRDDVWADPLKFPLVVIDAVYAAVGWDYPVGYRFSPEEIETPGIRWSLTAQLLEALCARPLAWIHGSTRDYRIASLVGDFEEPVISKILQVIDKRIPFIGVGSVLSRENADELLGMGSDLVAVGRGAIMNADFATRIREGREVEREIPAEGAMEKLVLPKGLADKIYATPGWFPIAEAVS